VITLGAIGSFLGGIGLFLLGMGLMTEGLKLAAGPALERILARSTSTRARGLASGILITALVQSSSAVTVAAIGFVNAGLLGLQPALWVLFGANVGTTMTGWLVAFVGLKFDIEALALPLIGAGMALRLTGEGARRGAFGTALAGVGVLFLGIDLLKDAFSGLARDFALPEMGGALGLVAQVLAGVLLTVLMQSSSAAMTVALTAAEGGLASTQVAAAVIIGANIGTSVKALIAAIGATPNARRAAAAHVIFNLLTGVAALALLPWLVDAIGAGRGRLGFEPAPAAELALFHTIFNVLGVVLMWPLAARLTAFLEARFRTAEEDEARPRHLDATVLAVPALALDALQSEVRRIGAVALRMVRAAVAREAGAAPALARDQRIVERLDLAAAAFATRLNRGGMTQESAQRLARILRIERYYETAAEQAAESVAAAGELLAGDAFASERVDAFRRGALRLLEAAAPGHAVASAGDLQAGLADVEIAYQALKAELLEAGAAGGLPIAAMEAELRAASAERRAIEQCVKAARILANG
jgi:phosphate:Na+ symporter